MLNTFQKFKKGKKFQKISFKRVKSFRSFNYCNWLPFCNFCIVTLLTFVTIYTFGTSVVFAGIANTKHDLSAGGPHTPGQTIYASLGQTTQKCVFCHTPHHSSTAGPLWNRNLSAEEGYTVPSQAEWLSLLSVPGQPDRGAKLCLSCHDGTVAIGSVLNMPGPGMAGTIAMTQDYITPGMTGYIGTDISAHHPVSIAYNDNLYNAKTTQCNNCQSALPIKPPASVTSPVRLRPTDNRYPPGGAQSLGVQCSSCHDPHNNSYGKFLVMAYDGENLCYACHSKCMATCE